MGWKNLNITNHEISYMRSEHKKKAKFLTDKNISQGLIDFMVSQGISIKTYDDYSLDKCPVKKFFSVSQKKNRILLTKDFRFWENRRFLAKNHPGVVILDYKNLTDFVSTIKTLKYIITPFAELWRESKVLIAGKYVKVYTKSSDDGRWCIIQFKTGEDGSIYIWEDNTLQFKRKSIFITPYKFMTRQLSH